MKELTTRERILRTCRHQEIDRMAMVDYPWPGTLRRWHNEGLPLDVDWRDYFDIDKNLVIHKHDDWFCVESKEIKQIMNRGDKNGY